MKLKTALSIIRKERVINLFYTPEGYQWISSGGVAYPLYGLPEMDADSLAVLLDISEKEKSKHHFVVGVSPSDISFKDYIDAERKLPMEGLVSIGYGGSILYPARTSEGLRFFDPTYLRPITEEYEIFERESQNGIYLAVKTGFLLAAIIMPKNVLEEDLAHRLENVLNSLKDSIEKKEASEIPGFNVDLNTGEIIEE